MVTRTGDPLDPADANDLVEGTMNYNYCSSTIPYWDITVDDTSIVAPLTDGQITEEDAEELYNNVLAFASYRFCLIEDEDKTPRGYDLVITSTGANSITIGVTSIVGRGTIYSPFGRRTFGPGYYEADPRDSHRHCNEPGWRNAPLEMMKFVNYNVVYGITPDYYLLVQGNVAHTDENYHAFAWRFKCSGTSGTCCSCSNACSGYYLDNEYCENQTEMNGFLDEFEYNFTHTGFWAPYGTLFMAMTNMYIDPDCSDDIKDRWKFYWNYGIVQTRTIYDELLDLACN